MTIALPANWVELVGRVAASEFDAAASHYKPALVEWAQNLGSLTDADFLTATQQAIYDSALVNRFGGNWEHEHFKATVCHREARRRHVAAGHDPDCRGETLYGRAHARVMRNHGYQPSSTSACTCGKD